VRTANQKMLNYQEPKPLAWYEILEIAILIIAVVISFILVLNKIVTPANAQKIENATTTPDIIIPPIIFSDYEKLTILQEQKIETDIVASKYAQLYDGCKNIRQEILNVIQ